MVIDKVGVDLTLCGMRNFGETELNVLSIVMNAKFWNVYQIVIFQYIFFKLLIHLTFLLLKDEESTE